jgi:hypothetical protein
MLAFELGSISFKIGMIIFILVLVILLSLGVLALFLLDEYREDKDVLFQMISGEELKEINLLASYKIFDRGTNVFFCEKGIVVRNYMDLRLIMYDDDLKNEFLRYLDW